MQEFKVHLENKDSLKKKPPRWKRSDQDGGVTITFPTGRKFKVEKFYEETRNFDIKHKGWYIIFEWDDVLKEWDYHDPYKPKGFAKQLVLEMGQFDKNGKKVADYSDTFEYE